MDSNYFLFPKTIEDRARAQRLVLNKCGMKGTIKDNIIFHMKEMSLRKMMLKLNSFN